MRKPISQMVFGVPVRHLPRAAQRAQKECKARARARLQSKLAARTPNTIDCSAVASDLATASTASDNQTTVSRADAGTAAVAATDFYPAIPRLRYPKKGRR